MTILIIRSSREATVIDEGLSRVIGSFVEGTTIEAIILGDAQVKVISLPVILGNAQNEAVEIVLGNPTSPNPALMCSSFLS